MARGKLAASTSLPEDTVRVSELCYIMCRNHKDTVCSGKALGLGEVEKRAIRWKQICLEQELETRPSLFSSPSPLQAFELRRGREQRPEQEGKMSGLRKGLCSEPGQEQVVRAVGASYGEHSHLLCFCPFSGLVFQPTSQMAPTREAQVGNATSR